MTPKGTDDVKISQLELSVDLRQITMPQLRALGLAKIAYIRPVIHDGNLAVGIHAADGTPMAVAADEASALEAILDHDLCPAYVQ